MATLLKPVPAVPAKACKHGARCLFRKALKKRKALMEAAEALRKVTKKHEGRLRMAHFVKSVADGYAATSPDHFEDVWEDAMLGENKKDNATSFADSYLKADIDAMQSEIEQAKKKLEKAAQALVAFIRNSKKGGFQDHLLKYHRHSYTDDKMKRHLMQAYIGSGGLPDWRHIDYCVAMVTDQLAQTEAGRTFLETLVDETALASQPAFKDTWDWFKKAKSVTDPMGKFVHNVAPVLVERIRHVALKKHGGSIASVLDDVHVKAHLTFLAERFGVGPASFIAHVKGRAKQLGSRSGAVVEAINEAEDVQQAVKKFDDLGQVELDGALAKLDNAWLGLTIDIVSFWVATAEIRQDMHEAKLKNWLGAVSALMALSKTIAETVEAKYVKEAGMLGDNVMQISTAKYVARGIGVMAGFLGIMISLMELDAKKNEDWDEYAVALAGVAVGVVEFIAFLAGAAALAAACTIIGILLAVIAVYVTDAPIINYLEDTAWGEDRGDKEFKLEGTIKKYFEVIFSLKVRYDDGSVGPFEDPDLATLQLTCGAFSNHAPVTVTVIRASDGEKQSVPILAGKHHASFDLTDKKGEPVRVGEPLTLVIKKPWETWSIIRRDSTTSYTIQAAFDANYDGAIDLKGEKTDIVFQPRPPAQLAKQQHYTAQRALFGHYVTTDHLNRPYIRWPDTGMLKLNVYTRYASGHKLKARATWDGEFSPSNARNNTFHSGAEWEKTTLELRIDEPEDSDGYEVDLEWWLLDTDGHELDDMDWSIRIRP